VGLHILDAGLPAKRGRDALRDGVGVGDGPSGASFRCSETLARPSCS
jgi:hypothetical protein